MGTPIEVSAKTKDHPEKQTLLYDFGDTLKEMTELFGEDIVHSNARAQMKVGLQAAMRRYIDDGKDVGGLATVWRPGVTLQRTVDPIASAKAAFATMSDEEKAAFIQSLQEG